ncbi:MAG TPA: hypothetical protein VHP11_04015 [Tepidisphaeraceae bacterium]|nr:hypothetical protein [Tepidisphaeraceae bacterium]
MTTETPASALPRYTVMPYKPDGGYTIPGMMMLISSLVLAGGLLGFVAHGVSNYFYLIVLFPVLIGLALGGIGICMTRKGRIRNPWIGGLAGFLGGVLAMSMMHYFDYLEFKTRTATFPPALRELAQLPPDEREQFLKPNLSPAERTEALQAIRAAGVQSMLDFMNFQAELGVELKKTGSHSKGLNLGYYGSYIYWLIEIFIVAGVTLAMIRASAAKPYCAHCDQWKREKILGSLGNQPAAAAAAIRTGDLAAIAALNPTPTESSTRVTLACCDNCVGQGPLDLKLDQITIDNKGNRQAKELAHITYPPEALPHLAALFANTPAPSTPPA